MSKIVFFCIPAYGHTNPTLGVVRELTARGHEVRYYSYEPMRTLIEAAGAQFVACDPYDCEQHLTPADGARVGKDIAFSTHILVETTLALDEMVCADMRAYAPDCIVADSMAVWGKAVAKKLGIPFISSTTTFAFNRYSAKVMKQSGGQMLKMLLAMPKINRDLQRLRDRGYPIKNILDIIQNDNQTDTIVYTSPEFQPCADTFSDKYAFVGPSIRPATETVEKAHDVLIYIRWAQSTTTSSPSTAPVSPRSRTRPIRSSSPPASRSTVPPSAHFPTTSPPSPTSTRSPCCKKPTSSSPTAA